MRWHIDNDVVVKVASLDLIDEMLAALGGAKSDVRVLSTARYKLNTGTKRQMGEAKYGKAAHERICAFVNTTATVDAVHGQSHIDVLTTLPHVDQGEAILIAETAAVPDSLLITGDKRSLRAIAGDRRGVATVQAISGRVLCFEQVVLAVVDKHGFDHVLPKLLAGMSCDARLTMACAGTPSETSVVGQLRDFVQQLRSETGTLLRI